MSNPVMERNPYFKAAPGRVNTPPVNRGNVGETSYDNDYSPYAAPSYQNQADAAYAGTAAPFSTAESMSYRDAMNKTAILLATAIISGVAAVVLFPPAALTSSAMICSLVAFVVGMVIAFKRIVPRGLALAYAVLEGVTLGALTGFLELYIPGIAIQTILATTVIVGVTLALHYSGKVRTTARGLKFVLIAAIGGIIFSFLNMLLMMFTNFNIRTDITFLGMPLGVGLGILMILVAAYMLIADFEAVQVAVQNGAPREFAWTCAIGIVMTIFWIYLEVLRIIAILADNR